MKYLVLASMIGTMLGTANANPTCDTYTCPDYHGNEGAGTECTGTCDEATCCIAPTSLNAIYVHDGETFDVTYAGITYPIQVVKDGCESSDSFINFLDLSLPESDQYALCEKIKEDSGHTGQFFGANWEPGGCWVDNRPGNNGATIFSTRRINGDPAPINPGYPYTRSYCVVAAPAGGDAGDPDPCDPAPTDAAEYIDAQCCVC